MQNDFDIKRIKKVMLRKYPSFGSTISNAEYIVNNSIATAGTDGKNIYYNENFIIGLSEEEQLFVLSHEVCHIALNHMKRGVGKDPQVWNIACDGVINQYLKKDGLPIIEGAIDFFDALNYDAEEIYDKLMQKKREQEKVSSQIKYKDGDDKSKNNEINNDKNGLQDSDNQVRDCINDNQSKQDGENNDNLLEGDVSKILEKRGVNFSAGGHDDHSMWYNEQNNEKEQSGEVTAENKKEFQKKFDSEVEAFNKNQEDKLRYAEDIMSKLSANRRGCGEQTSKVVLYDIGMPKSSVVNWKKVLVQNLEIEDERWGYRFSDKSTIFRARIEDFERDEKGRTEIILDVSGSISHELLKNFLRQMKMLLKESEIKVGFFADSFLGWEKIKKERDIDCLKIPTGVSTNFDSASQAFSKGRYINRICFTDGCDGGYAGIKELRSDIIWISFANPNFKPDKGKVIYVSPEEINGVNNFELQR